MTVNLRKMVGFLAVIGALFLSAAVCGWFFDGIAFHLYFGTSDGAHEWHQQYADGEISGNQITIR